MKLPWYIWLILVIAALGLLWWAVTSLFNGDLLRGFLALLGGVGGIVGAAKVTPDKGRPARGDLGARGITVREVKDEHGNVKRIEKRDRPYRSGSSGFFLFGNREKED